MKVLVTGGNGFIGSHLVEALLEKNYEVVCLVRETDDLAWIEGLNSVKYVYGDVTVKKSLLKAVEGVDYVYHLAAVIVARKYVDYSRVNRDGTRNLVEVCIEAGLNMKRFLFVSSIAAGGPTGKDEIMNEEKEGTPISDYGKSKLETESYLKFMGDKIPFTVVRLPIMYGPRDRGAIYSYFKAINRGVKPFMGKGSSNICYVKDAVKGMILAAEGEVSRGKIYLVAQRGLFSRKEIASSIENAIGKKVIPVRIPLSLMLFTIPVFWLFGKFSGKPAVFNMRNYNDLKYGYWRYSTGRIENELGFNAEFELDKGVKLTADWYKNNNFL